MKVVKNVPPREYECGFEIKRKIKDCAHITLDSDEQVTFFTKNGSEYDFCKKDFGFYATPSLNSRLLKFNLRSVLVKNRLDHFYVFVVEKEKEPLFKKYMDEEKMEIVVWLDNSDNLMEIYRHCRGESAKE